jgi:hypothetical protein
MLTSAEAQELRGFRGKDIKKVRKDFGEWLEPKLPYYSLLEKIRIHDFHRFGCLPPDPAHREVFVGGPTKLVAKKGTAAIVMTPRGPRHVTTGSSRIQEQRPLYTDDGLFFDEKSRKYLPLEDVLHAYLNAIPKVLAEFESLRIGVSA